MSEEQPGLFRDPFFTHTERTDLMSKMPYISFYVGDYIKSTRVLTLEEKGAWTEILWHIWEHGQSGTVEGTWEDIALIIGCPNLEKCKQIFGKIHTKKVCEMLIVVPSENLEKEVVNIVNRRMNREFKLKTTRTETGNLGGRPGGAQTKTKPKPNQIPDIDNDNDNGIEIVNETEYSVENGIKNKLAEFFNYRVKKRKPILEESKEAFLRKLTNYSGGNEAVAWEILDTTIANGWQGIFRPNEQTRKQSSSANRQERVDSVSNIKNLATAILENHQSQNGS